MGKIGPANSSGYQLLATCYYSYCNGDWYGFSSASSPITSHCEGGNTSYHEEQVVVTLKVTYSMPQLSMLPWMEGLV